MHGWAWRCMAVLAVRFAVHVAHGGACSDVTYIPLVCALHIVCVAVCKNPS